MSWFYSAPVWLTLPGFVIVYVAVSLAVVVALRPFVRRWSERGREWDRVVGYSLTTFGVFFGIFLALVAVSVYQNYVEVHQAVLAETSALGVLYRDSSGFPPSEAAALHHAMRSYAESVISHDWPLQQQGVLPQESTVQLLRIQDLLFAVEPRGAGKDALYTQTISAFNDLVSARRTRIDETQLALPGMLWLVIWVGGAINAVLIASVEVRRLRLHLTMAGLLALFVGLVIFMTSELDHPYAGAISVGSEAFRDLLEQVLQG